MIDQIEIERFKKRIVYRLGSAFSFILSGICCLFIIGGTFTTRREVLNQMTPTGS